MIRTLTFRGRLDGRDPQDIARAVETHVSQLIRTRKTLLGARTSWDSEAFDVSLRMSGMDRWQIARDARKVASYVLASQRLAFTRPLNPILEQTESTARNLTLESGRTPQSVKGGRGRRKRPEAAPSAE